MTPLWFITGIGTEIGKTWMTRGLTGALRARGVDVRAVKPMETGCTPDPLDAVALAVASGQPELAHADGFHRAESPVSPRAATMRGELPDLDLDSLVRAVRGAVEGSALGLVEGAGGLLVPLTETLDTLDLARALGAPLLLVAADQLGVLSHTLTAVEAAQARGWPVRAIVMTSPQPGGDTSRAENRDILAERVAAPIFRMPRSPDSDPALMDAAEASGLPAWLVAQVFPDHQNRTD